MMQTLDYEKELDAIARAYAASGGDPSDFHAARGGVLVVSGNRALLGRGAEGLTIESEQLSDGIRARIVAHRGATIAEPVHLCFGMVPVRGVQRILAEFVIKEGASVRFLAHCTFPNAVEIRHIMEGTVEVGENARMEYEETHYHGETAGIETLPKMRIRVAAGGLYRSTFKLAKGVAGVVDLDYDVVVAEEGIAELYAKIYGKGDDRVKVRESIHLDGRGSRGLAKSRIVVTDRASAEVLGEIVGAGPGSRGHVDCMEIIKGGKAQAVAVPLLRVVEESAKLTHEAAIGSVDKRQMETLMARGLSESEAVDVIVRGLLR